jgi:hypothetical protein
MSLTQSRGLTDAGRWTAVAATLADHLDALENARGRGGSVPPPPQGAIEAARRFFNFALAGIELDQERRGRSVARLSRRTEAAAAGISNLSIAVKVIRPEKPATSPAELVEVEHRIKDLLNSLRYLRSRGRSLSPTQRKSLALFFRDLQRQGEMESDAALAFQEGPRAYRTPVL